MNANIFRGVGVALVTPFQTNGSIDYNALEKIINFTIEGGVNFLVCLGTTGESPTLSSKEKLEVLDFTIKINNNRLPIVYGVGGNNTHEVIEQLAHLPTDKIAAILSVSPYYNKPSQEGIYQHFKAVSNASTLPIIMYNVPGRTGSNMSVDTIVRLANEFKNIVAIKDACGNVMQNLDVIRQAPSNFLVLSGDDDLVVPQISIGVQGVISVAANCYTKDFCTMTHLALDGNFTEARKIAFKLHTAIGLLFAEGNPPGVKYVMSKMGLCENNFRLPVVSISEELKARIDNLKIG